MRTLLAVNFMAADLGATSLAFVLFSLFAVVPGYVLSWSLDLLRFRSRAVLARFVISVPVSIATFPVLTFLAWQWSVAAVWALFATCWLAFPALVFHRWQRPVVSRRVVVLGGIVAGWVIVGMLCLIDLQIGNRLYFPTVSYDYMLRAAITSSITRSGVPPDNPYFFPGHAFPLRYHYFWFLACSLVDRLGGLSVSARQAMIAGTLWCGIGLMAMVPLYLRFFQPKGAANLDRRTLAGVALFAVTGLDIVPTAILSVLRNGVIGSVEWWNSPVMGWTHAVLWVPHHVAALIACLTGFLVVYHSFGSGRMTRVFAAIAAGVMFASGVGLSIYVTFVFAAGVGVLVALLLLKRYRSEAAILAAAGVVAVAVALPYLRDLSGGTGEAAGADRVSANTNAGPLFQFAVRPFTLPDSIVQRIWPGHSWLAPVTDFLLLPLNYFLELGLFSIVGVVVVKKFRRTRPLTVADISGLAIAMTSVLICTFVRSSVITNNDLGWRGFLVAQFFLLIWATELWDEGFFVGHARPALIAALLLFGVAGTGYEISMVRFYTLISDRFDIPRDQWFPADHHIGERTYAMRTLYEDLRKKLSPIAVLQHNPSQPLGDVFHGLYADRQVAVETPGCGVIFGGDANLCSEIMPSIADMFDTDKMLEWTSAQTVCGDASLDTLIVKSTDTIWADRRSWVWEEEPVFANGYARAFSCRGHGGRSK